MPHLDEALAGAASLFLALAEQRLPELDPQGPLACAVDLWGPSALSWWLDWGERPAAPRLEGVLMAPGRALVTARWGHAGHGTRLVLLAHQQAWLAHDALPQADDAGPLDPIYTRLEAEGVNAGYCEPATEPVEALIRARAAEHALGPVAIVDRVLFWRLARKTFTLPPFSPAGWAAAIEYQVLKRADVVDARERATACYGATTRELERATFLLEAGLRLHGS